MKFNKKSKIYIAGSSGFVGKNLVNYLRKKGYLNIITSESYKVDLTIKFEVFNFFQKNKFDYVFICAAKVGGIQSNINSQFNFLLVNLAIETNLISACLEFNIKKTLFLGSSCIYPKDYIQPLKEEYLLKNILEPTNEGYALAKICGLKLCEYANKEYRSNFISLMPCNLFGPNDHYNSDSSHVISSLISRLYKAKVKNTEEVEIWGSGIQRREFLYINDLLDCIEWSMLNLQKTETFLNVGSGIDITIKDLAILISKKLKYSGKLVFNTKKPDGMKLKCLDVSKINKLGWKSKINLDYGLTLTIKDFLINEN